VHKNRKGTPLIALLILFISLSPGDMAQGNKHLEDRLLAVLQKFAKNNNLSGTALQELLGGLVLDSPQLRKGGVGIIGNSDVYVSLDEERNALILPAGKEWHGKKSTEGEVVLVDNERVLGSIPVPSTSNLKIIIFSPSDVHYVDMSLRVGGKYARYTGPPSPQ